MINFRMLRVADRSLFYSVCVLLLISILMIASTTYFSELKAGKDAFLFIKKQLGSITVGFILMGIFSFIDYKRLKDFAPFLFVLTILLLLAGHFLGVSSMGAQRWIMLGPFSFQPSEIAKIVMIITLAAYFDKIKEKSSIIISLLITALPFLIVFKQPDLGTSIIIAALTLGMLIYTKNSPILVVMIFTPLLSVLFRQNIYLWLLYLLVLWAFLYFSRVEIFDMAMIMAINLAVGIALSIFWGMMKEYQRMRILTFLNPGLDPRGMGYHTLQSMIAVGAGGIFGKGLFHGTQTQLQFIPIQHSDFIFSAIGEEFGLIGSVIVLSLFFNIIWRAIVISQEAEDFFGSLLAVGIAVLIGFHAFVNIGMTIGLLPVVGIPLPFVSYGGTSLIVNMAAIGILESIAMRRQRLIF
ncbi:MAG: rod shape-determining protein RodA [Candidatus Saganbacteria bacterium]|uniref:Peptidoglycan glycosyltransferase RodA n=1 Tax=Candidatus Saganbacteria bacterium TaxID=2575572 RepID=A0A833P2R5_UNCSA|nr:MAG: rod shape-determining protein RodA [Candidatus Saganbacteria bacterium]